MIQRFATYALVSLSAATLVACGSDAKGRKDPNLAGGAELRQHDFTSTWVYAVGEVQAPTAKDCQKALEYVDAESNCVGAICKHATNLANDFEAACSKMSSSAELQKATELRASLASRAAERPSECAKMADEWLERGCGSDGDCEPALRQWATRCSEEVKSPLAMHLLERLVENSLREPRRIKFDVQGCVDSKKKLKEAAHCATPFECEGALKWIDAYVERCAEGNHSGIPAEQAAQVMRIRFGANKPTDPISISKSKSKVISQTGLLAFSDGSGAVVHVCDEPVTDLRRYIEQRRKCEDGAVTVFLSVATGEGISLEVRHLRHESDASFTAAHPEMMVLGEAEMRK